MTHQILQHEFLTKKHLAELFHVHNDTIDTWVQKSRLPRPVSFGGNSLWNTEALKHYIQSEFVRHGYSVAQTANIFARANLAPPGDYIEIRVPKAMLTKSAHRRFGLEELQRAVVAYVTALHHPDAMPVLGISPAASLAIEHQST